MNSCIIPIPAKDFDGDNRWLSIHKRFLQECKEKDPEGKQLICSYIVVNV